jgi:hypothetical protein
MNIRYKETIRTNTFMFMDLIVPRLLIHYFLSSNTSRDMMNNR